MQAPVRNDVIIIDKKSAGIHLLNNHFLIKTFSIISILRQINRAIFAVRGPSSF